MDGWETSTDAIEGISDGLSERKQYPRNLKFPILPILFVVLSRVVCVVGVLFLACGIVKTADADSTEREIRVSSPDVYSDVLEPAGPGGRGVIVVYLQSAGDPVHGYKVELFDVRAQRLLETKLSDAAGVIRFAVQAGSYRIYLRRTQHQMMTSSVAIAEIRVE